MLIIKEELYDLNNFNFWSGAVSRWEEIKELGLENEVMDIVLESYPDGATKTELNDLIWFGFDEIIEETKENLNIK